MLVFPASNGYNSYHDNDEGSIGGLKSPPKPTKYLLKVVNCMDAGALILCAFINGWFVFFVAVYILFSRLYSNRKVRLKKYPLIGFLVVIIIQGAWVFSANVFTLSSIDLFARHELLYAAIACSFFIATVYPLTQIYQHKADKADGVKTLSILLGTNGTFVFSALMFSIATMFIYLSFQDVLNNFWLFNIAMFPATMFFLIWAFRSFNNPVHVNFKNTMTMLVLSSLLNNLYFIILLIKQ